MTRPERLRLTGKLVFASGIVVAAVFYWIQARSAQPEMDEAAAGYVRAQEHQMKLLMGPLAVTMSQWADFLTQPGTEAVLIVAFAAFVTYMCYRHAQMD